MAGPFHYLESAPEPEGTALGVGVSLTLHVAALLFVFLQLTEQPKEQAEPLRFVELVPPAAMGPAAMGLPRSFVEAPGPAIEEPVAPGAPLSDANRRASAPSASGPERTTRPGDGSGNLHIPATGAPAAPRPAGETARGNGPVENLAPEEAGEALQYRVAPEGEGESTRQVVAAGPDVDWNSAIREAGRVVPSGEGGRLGGELGFAESGPISFESQWYDWGPYAAQMVARIRLHWYNHMPDIIRMGLKGVVVIRFTIQRNGQITDIEMLQSSGVPPYDFAARKAIELASPLSPLPADFPQPSERVTAGFYYNSTPPR
ncbi:MAG TPA: TonB family protein [Thermoanaerobaculia bacterium]|nr:TonB family protein [Thermoanaerobaculia bacterium]